jgi:hypothetical protein
VPNTDLKLYNDTDLQNARTKGQLVGWIQGGGAVLVTGIALNLLGWIPALLVIAVVGYALYRVMR